jgi:hypothetical protein
VTEKLKDLYKVFSKAPADKGLRKKQVGRLILQHAEEKPLSDPGFAGWVFEFSIG